MHFMRQTLTTSRRWSALGDRDQNEVLSLWHSPYKPAGILALDESQSGTDMTAAHFGAGEVLCALVKMHIAMIDLDEQLHRGLQPNVQAPDAGCFDNDAVVQIAQRHV